MRQENRTLNFSEYRRHKQLQAEEQVNTFLDDAFYFAIHNTNIREKVRAKMLFGQRFGYTQQELNQGKIEKLFMEWFLYDYKTIKGNTVLFQYIQKNEHKFSEPLKMLGALFLAAAWEPVKVVDHVLEGNRHIFQVQNIIHEKIEHVISNNTFRSKDIQVGTLYFIRKIQLVTGHGVLGTEMPATNEENILQMKNEYHTFMEHKEITWRSFLKEQAPKYFKRSY